MARRDDSKRRTSGMSNREEVKARQQREARQKLIPIILIGVAAILVVAFLVIPPLIPSPSISRPLTSGMGMGNQNALVKVEEFADFQCPACSLFVTEMEPQIIKDYIETNKIYFQYIPFAFIGPESNTTAEAAYCAMDQGKFWEYHDKLYSDQHGENKGYFSNSRLLSYATDLKLNVADFTTCFNGGKYKQKVLDDVAYGTKNKIDSTPSFLVNGKLVHADTLDSTIKAELAAKGVK